jgi:hypothetical protein
MDLPKIVYYLIKSHAVPAAGRADCRIGTSVCPGEARFSI